MFLNSQLGKVQLGDLLWEDSKGMLLQSLGIELVTSWPRSQISDGSPTSNERLIVYIIDCRASESEGKMRGRCFVERFSWWVISKGCPSKPVGSKNRKAIVDNLQGLSYAQAFHVKMGGLVSCKNIWTQPPPLLPPFHPALYPLAPPINASVTPHRHAEDARRAADAAPSRSPSC